jgi:hypothetical protein
MEDPCGIESFHLSKKGNGALNHSAEEGTSNKLRGDTGPQVYSQDASQLSTVLPSIDSLENDCLGSDRPSPVVQHVQALSVSVPGTLQQPALIDGIGSTEPRLLIKKKGRFTVTPDALPGTPKMVERPASINLAQTTPTTIQKGRFTVTPDTDAVPMHFSSDNSAPTAPIFVAGLVAPPKVEKKGRFVVSSAVPTGVVVDSEITQLQTFERPSSMCIPVATVPHAIVEPLGQQPHPAPQGQTFPPAVPVGNVAPSDHTTASPAGSEEKSTIMSGGSGVTRLGKPPASFDSKGVGSNVGLGKVFYFLEQMKAEVSEADRTTKLLQKEVKFLKEKNKELEAKSREMEKRWKDQKANREAAEAKVRLLKKKLRELKHEGTEDELLGEYINDTPIETGKSSRSSSIGESDEVSKSNTNGCNTDSLPDVLEKLNLTDGPSTGVQSRRRASNDSASMQTPSKPVRMSSVEDEKSHGTVAAAAAGPQKPVISTSSRPPMAESRHARHWSGSSITAGSGNMSQLSDDGSKHVVHPTHKRASSNSEAGIVGANLNGPCALANGAVGINGTCPQQNQPGVTVAQKAQQAWNQGQYPIVQQQQSLQNPPINSHQGTGMNHQVIQQGLHNQPQQGMQVISQRQSLHGLQLLSQQQPHGVATLSQQQQLGMPPLTHQQSAQTTQQQHQSSQGMSMISQSQQPTQAMPVPQQNAMGMQPQAFVTQQQSHTPQKLQAQSAVSHPQSLTQQQQGMTPSMLQHQHTSPSQQQTKAQQQQSSAPQQLQPGLQQQLPSLQHQLQKSQPLQQQQQQQGSLPIQTIPGVGGNAHMSQQQQPFSAHNAQQQPSMQPALNGLQWS